jgi:cyclase
MEIREVKPGVFFVDRPNAEVNVFFLRTTEGIVLIDTTMGEDDMQAIMEKAGFTRDEVALVILTHADPDHIGGLGLYSCPVICHRLTRERMVQDQVLPPGQPIKTFQDQHFMEVGGVRIELIYQGGHKVDQSIIWLPQSKTLIASDQLVQGCYPVTRQSSIPTWIDVLQRLPKFGAEAILPGHGTVCSRLDVALFLRYLQRTWALTAKHVEDGWTLIKILEDASYPRPEGWTKTSRHDDNIEEMYRQLVQEP